MTSILPISLGGDAKDPINPSFRVTIEEAEAALHQMTADRRPFERPVLVIAGYLDPGVGASLLASSLRRLTTSPGQVIEVSLLTATTFDACRTRVIAKVEESVPSGQPDRTAPVDVVGISMGGLVARFAAMNPETGGARLDIRRLFTVSTPHRGASMAQWPSLDPRHLDMRAGSDFLRRLDLAIDAGAAYPIVPYVRLGDAMVGAENAALHGQTPWWLANRTLQPAHLGAHTDPRILADIARRLRGETPFTTEPRTPLPGAASG